MMLYLIFIPGIVGQLFLINYLIRIRREDKVINEFCRVRERTIAFLDSEQGQLLTNKQYGFARWMLEVNSVTIADFYDIKHRLNITSTLSSLRHIDHDVVRPARTSHYTDNERLQGLYHELIGAMIKGFVAYTPFFNSKIALSFTLYVARFLAKWSITYIKVRAQEYTQRWDSINEGVPEYCLG